MVVTLGQQYNIGEKPTVILYTYINRHAGTPEKQRRQDKTKYQHHVKKESLEGTTNKIINCSKPQLLDNGTNNPNAMRVTV